MKRAVLAIGLVVLAALAVAQGCSGTPQGNGITCMPLGAGDMGPDGGVGCFFPATAAAQRTPCGEVTQYCDTSGTTTPNTKCLGDQDGGAASPAPGAPPAKVTLTGFLHPFASGPDTTNLTVQVFTNTMGTDPVVAQPVGSMTAVLMQGTERACDVDPTVGCSIPLADGCMPPTCHDGLNLTGTDMGRPDDRKYCRDNGTATGQCSDRLRWEARYTVANVPTNTQLAIRVSGPTGTWTTTVQFNVVLSTSDHACTSLNDNNCIDTSDAANPKYQLNLTTLSRADFSSIPVAAGLPGGISANMGAVLGEVRDCDNVRLANIQVQTTPTADRYTYFNGDPLMPLPDVTRASIGTDRLGLFAALNQRPGRATVETAGAAAVGAALDSFGTADVFVYGGELTLVNVNGGKALK
jgi:hypothetical protein